MPDHDARKAPAAGGLLRAHCERTGQNYAHVRRAAERHRRDAQARWSREAEAAAHACDPLACGIYYDPACPVWHPRQKATALTHEDVVALVHEVLAQALPAALEVALGSRRKAGS